MREGIRRSCVGVADGGGRVSADEKKAAARIRREQKLLELSEVVRVCSCTWPLDVFRNISGHDPECPAHKLIMSNVPKEEEDA